MTETGEETNRSKPLAGEVTIYRKPSYTVVKFVLRNPAETPIDVHYEQRHSGKIPDSHVTFASQYHGDSWTLRNETLDFRTEIDGGATLRTAYGVKGIDVEQLRTHVDEATVTTYDQTGQKIGQLTGLDPSIADQVDEGEGTAGTPPEESGESSNSTTKTPSESDENASEESATGEDGQEPSTRPSSESDTTTQVDGEDPISTIRSSEGQGTMDEAKFNSQPESDTEVGEDEQSANESDEAAGLIGDIDAGSYEWTSTDTQTEESGRNETGRNETESEAADERDEAMDLPANRADYVLGDVRGEIESPAEFDWITLEGKQSTSSRILGWVRSLFG